jgi:hypothetical protein
MIDLHYWPTPNGWKASIMLKDQASDLNALARVGNVAVLAMGDTAFAPFALSSLRLRGEEHD